MLSFSLKVAFSRISWVSNFSMEMPELSATWEESDPWTQEVSSTVLPSREFQHSTRLVRRVTQWQEATCTRLHLMMFKLDYNSTNPTIVHLSHFMSK